MLKEKQNRKEIKKSVLSSLSFYVLVFVMQVVSKTLSAASDFVGVFLLLAFAILMVIMPFYFAQKLFKIKKDPYAWCWLQIMHAVCVAPLWYAFLFTTISGAQGQDYFERVATLFFVMLFVATFAPTLGVMFSKIKSNLLGLRNY